MVGGAQGVGALANGGAVTKLRQLGSQCVVKVDTWYFRVCAGGFGGLGVLGVVWRSGSAESPCRQFEPNLSEVYDSGSCALARPGRGDCQQRCPLFLLPLTEDQNFRNEAD